MTKEETDGQLVNIERVGCPLNYAQRFADLRRQGILTTKLNTKQ